MVAAGDVDLNTKPAKDRLNRSHEKAAESKNTLGRPLFPFAARCWVSEAPLVRVEHSLHYL